MQSSNLENKGTIDLLVEFNETISTQYTFDDALYEKYSLFILELFDIDGNVVNSVTFPVGTFMEKGGKRYVYGTSTSMWGYIEIVIGNLKAFSLNRTSSNTLKMNVYGVRK